MSAPRITFWHCGIEKVVTGFPTGNVVDAQTEGCEGMHRTGALIEILWVDAKDMAFKSWVHESNILDYTKVA